MIKIGARQNYKAALCFAGSRPAMIMLALAPPAIAVVCSISAGDAGSADRDRPTGFVILIGRFPNKHSTDLGNRPPTPKSP